MKRKNILFYILIIVSFISISLLLSNKVLQNDTFYTIKIGESITKYGVDMKDHFSWIPNLAYTYPHWLYDLVIFVIYDLGGFNFLHVSTIILGFILLLLMFCLTNKVVSNRPVSFMITFIFGFCLHGFFTVRAQMVSYIFLLIILYSIEMLRSTKKKKYYLYLFISSLIIANMHLAVWPFIFVLFLPFLVQDIIYKIDKKYKLKLTNHFDIELEDSCLKITLVGLLCCFITGFLTPNFLVPFTYLFNTFRGDSMEHISEHLPLNISKRKEVFVLLFVFLCLVLRKKDKIKLRDLFLICGLFLMSFMSIRNVSLLFILSIFSFSRLFNYKFIILDNIITSEMFCVVISFFFVLLIILNINYYKNINYIKEKNYPVKASDYILENLDYKNIKLYNGYNYGSYLIYRGIPVFIDSRADLYLKEFNPSINVFDDSNDDFDNYKSIFSSYKITHILLNNGYKLNSVLKLDNDYNIIYEDDYFTLYEVLNYE